MSFTKENILTSSILVVYYLCVLVQGSWLDEKTSPFRHFDDENTLAFMTWNDAKETHLLCQEFIEQALIRESMMPPGIEISHRISKEQVQIMMRKCKAATKSLRRGKRQTQKELEANYERFVEASTDYSIIFPGTKWCGAGNIAKNDNDLGYQADTDRCCRTHDMCDDFILAGQTGHGLKNDGRYTASNCRCDNALYDCLDQVDTITSNVVGNLYFNILQSRCFKKDYPQTKKCKTYATNLRFRCQEYEQDTTKPKVYQWFPAKEYRKIPIIDKTTRIPFNKE